MFGNIRKKFNSVIQDGLALSENFRSGSGSSSTSPSPLGTENSLPTIKSGVPTSINLCAGHELLDKNERNWNELHATNEKNSDKAREIDRRIVMIKLKTERMSTDLSDFNISLTQLPTVITSLKGCMETIEDIKEKCQTLDEKLFQLEDLLEVLDLQEKQLDHRFEMAMYKEKKLADLESVRQELANNHAANVREYENSLRKVQQERQMAFQDAFQDDLKVYKEKGVIPSKSRQLFSSIALMVFSYFFNFRN